jgi:hypothetical protein
MGDRSSEEGHNPIAEQLIHCPLIVMNCVHHRSEGVGEKLGSFFRIGLLNCRG